MKARSLLLLAALGCRSASPPPEPPMPFRVRLAPLQRAERLEDGRDEGLRLEIGEQELEVLNARLEEELDGSCFAFAELLDPGGFVGVLDDEDWLARATLEGEADLLLTFRLRYGTTIYEGVNPVVHAAAPFSWLPGPQMWPVPDRRYGADCFLTVHAYDLSRHAQAGGVAQPGNRSWYFTHTIPLGNLYSTFLQRAGSELHYYLAGIVVPVLLLDLEQESFEEELRQRAVEVLAQRMAEDLRSLSLDLVRNEHEYSFFLVDRFTEIVATDEDWVDVRIVLAHEPGSGSNEPRALRLVADCGDRAPSELQLDWQDVERAHLGQGGSESLLFYGFDLRVQVSPRTRSLRLRVTVGSSPRVWREFSLPLERGY